jgi:hypothetical protein
MSETSETTPKKLNLILDTLKILERYINAYDGYICGSAAIFLYIQSYKGQISENMKNFIPNDIDIYISSGFIDALAFLRMGFRLCEIRHPKINLTKIDNKIPITSGVTFVHNTTGIKIDVILKSMGKADILTYENIPFLHPDFLLNIYEEMDKDRDDFFGTDEEVESQVERNALKISILEELGSRPSKFINENKKRKYILKKAGNDLTFHNSPDSPSTKIRFD